MKKPIEQVLSEKYINPREVKGIQLNLFSDQECTILCQDGHEAKEVRIFRPGIEVMQAIKAA